MPGSISPSIQIGIPQLIIPSHPITFPSSPSNRSISLPVPTPQTDAEIINELATTEKFNKYVFIK